MSDPSPILDALKVFCTPGQVVELRALNVQGRRAVCEVFDDLEAMARRATQLDAAGAMGCYFTPNPLRPTSEWAGGSLKAADVLCRHWLLIDCDPRHPAGTSCDDAEQARARWLLDACREALEPAGLRGAVVSDSGNGWHLCYPVEMANDPAAQELIRDILRALQERCGDPLTEEDRLRLKARQFLPEPRAGIGVECHDATRIWKLPGTMARKGVASFDRPHRRAALIEGQPWDAETARHNTAVLPRVLAALLETWTDLDRFGAGYRPSAGPSREETYARKALRDECAAVAATAVGTGLNDQLSRSAFKVGRYVQPGLLTYEEAAAALYLHALQAGANDPRKDKATISRQLKAGMQHPWDRNLDTATHHPRAAPLPNADTSTDPLDADATAADLIAANATIRWGWSKWLQHGVLNVLASEPGIGKTRFCADLARRLYHGLVWPDGEPATFPKGSCTLWVPADNQHAELATLAQVYGFPPELLYLNATRRNPFAGTMLDDPNDLRDFEARIRRLRPALVFVDTSLNATDRSSHKPEDAKAFFVPLQQIAIRTGAILVMVTHLNAAGKPLGRRIQGQARLVMQLEKPDPAQEHRRKLYVVKSNSLYPAPLGVTMGDTGNEYDTNPPMAPEENPTAQRQTKVQAAVLWLSDYLSGGPKRVTDARREAETKTFSADALYTAKDRLGVEEFKAENRKWWRLAETNGQDH